jgi:anti-anti-sigma regulatory factor
MAPFEIDSTPDAVRLRLNFEVTIEQARALHTALLTALNPVRPLEMDPAALTRIDAAVLQVLLAAAQLAPRAFLTAPSSVWTAALERHGAADPFFQS